MKRKLRAVGQEQASSLPTRLHIPMHRGFPTACHRSDCLQQEETEECVSGHKICPKIQAMNNVAI